MEVTDPNRRLSQSALRWLRAGADASARALSELEGAAGQVRVRVVGDAEMAAAHDRHLGIPGTTDVLTFDLSEEGAPLDVDILACVDEAARQADHRGLRVERELLLYIVHGTLHCLGYDDHTEEESRAMHAREDEILERIGIGATYAPRELNTAGAGHGAPEVSA